VAQALRARLLRRQLEVRRAQARTVDVRAGPLAIRGSALSARRDAFVALGLGAVAFAVYVATLPPSYGDWDVAELQTVATIFGIAHPPGCPAFTLLAYAFVHVFSFGEPAWRVKLLCSLCIAGSVGLLYVVARRFGLGRVTSALCALGFAFSFVAWHNATRAEVQSLALLLRALALYFGLRWFDRGTLRDLFSMALCAGFACATHGISALLLPALAFLVVGHSGWNRPRALALIAGGIALGLLPFAYLPLRSTWIDAHHLEPTLALGLPPGMPLWNYDDPSTWPNFVRLVTGADFHVAGGFAGFFDLMRYPYFGQQLGNQVAHAYGYAGTLLALGGACLVVLSRRLDGIALVAAALVPVPYTESYSDLQEPERYYVLALWCAAILIGIAFERSVALFELRPRSVGWYGAAACLVASFATCAPERADFPLQRTDRFGPDFVAEVRSFTPDDAIVLAAWGYATPLAYAAYVDGTLGHRTVVVGGATQYIDYVPRWLGHRPVFIVSFDGDLLIPGWHVQLVKSNVYSAYRLTK
jgi:hypothetical protein